MGDDSFIGILIFGAIAVFLAHRLWQVLGRRDGDAPPAGPIARQAVIAPLDRVVPTALKTTSIIPGEPLSLEGSIKLIKAADPSFDEKQFLAGANTAFGIILNGFSTGNREQLRPLLGDAVYNSFDAAIGEREAAGQTQETSIARISNSIESASLNGDMARIVVAFRSGQTNVVRGNDGTIIEGDARRIEDVLDIWTFARDVKSRDPNWTLVETRHQA
jgi:predicted lipid-binding transport protein (Tim44 family)